MASQEVHQRNVEGVLYAQSHRYIHSMEMHFFHSQRVHNILSQGSSRSKNGSTRTFRPHLSRSPTPPQAKMVVVHFFAEDGVHQTHQTESHFNIHLRFPHDTLRDYRREIVLVSVRTPPVLL